MVLVTAETIPQEVVEEENLLKVQVVAGQEVKKLIDPRQTVTGKPIGLVKMLMVTTPLMTPKPAAEATVNHPKETTLKALEDTKPLELRDKVTLQLVSRKTSLKLAPRESCSSPFLHRTTLPPLPPQAPHPLLPSVIQS